MKAIELRIGNRIVFSEEGKECEVNAIDQEGVQIKFADSTTWIELEYFDGIGLTEDWLIKFEFKQVKPKRGVQKAYKKAGIRIEISNSGNFYWKNKPLQYVHTLQNIFFFNELTGEEFIIK